MFKIEGFSGKVEFTLCSNQTTKTNMFFFKFFYNVSVEMSFCFFIILCKGNTIFNRVRFIIIDSDRFSKILNTKIKIDSTL